MKKILKFIVFVAFVVTCYIYRSDISNYILENIVIDKKIVIAQANTYYKNNNYSYVQITDDFEPENKQELLNIFYTMLNNGWTNFEFYCDVNYDDCYNDITNITKETDDLSTINNMVNPFNSYEYLSFEMSNLGKVSITIDKLYKDDDVTYVNQEINRIMNEILADGMSDKEKIRSFHDYIVNLIDYDESDNAIKQNGSNKANNALLNKVAVCSGYSDLMAIFLDKLELENYKIINSEHVWNLVKVDDEWLHIDLTWDDPTTSNGRSILIHDFFLIDTEKLESISTKIKNNQHVFDKTVYIEAN